MAHAQKQDFVFRRNGRVHLNRRGRQFSRLLAAEVWSSAVIVGNNAGYTMFWGSLKGTCYPLHSPVSPSVPLPGSPCAITFQLESTDVSGWLAARIQECKENNITMDLRYMWGEDVNWINVGQYSNKWRAVVSCKVQGINFLAEELMSVSAAYSELFFNSEWSITAF